jgi:putative NIF3 family GTP cyclohydrolase 1 type 2
MEAKKMIIQDIIKKVQDRATWVDYEHTRDVILYGDANKDVDSMGICWVATNKALKQAVEENIHFIITHENFLYVEGTSLYKGVLESRTRKINLCRKNDITVYRLHDGWDQFPEYGVADCLAVATRLPFKERVNNSFYHYAELEMTVREVAQHVADGLAPYGDPCVEILGNPNKTVKSVAMGVGAETNFEKMDRMKADCFIVADDGTENWIAFQWCLDNEIPLIICHHSVNEMAGMDGMVSYFQKECPTIRCKRLTEGYIFTPIISGKTTI